MTKLIFQHWARLAARVQTPAPEFDPSTVSIHRIHTACNVCLLLCQHKRQPVLMQAIVTEQATPVCSHLSILYGSIYMQESPMYQLLNDAQREVVADVVNAALLASATGKPKWEVKPQVSPSSYP